MSLLKALRLLQMTLSPQPPRYVARRVPSMASRPPCASVFKSGGPSSLRSVIPALMVPSSGSKPSSRCRICCSLVRSSVADHPTYSRKMCLTACVSVSMTVRSCARTSRCAEVRCCAKLLSGRRLSRLSVAIPAIHPRPLRNRAMSGKPSLKPDRRRLIGALFQGASALGQFSSDITAASKR